MDIKKIILEEIYLNKYLNEGASDVLYHFTYPRNVINILKTNELNLTAAIGSKSDLDINKQKYFFLSTTRSKNSGYTGGTVKLVLDGRKLKYNNKITPVDYWQYSKKRSDWGSDADYTTALKSSEQEDRVVSNKSTIENARDYILEIHYYSNDDIKDLIEVANKYNIPLYIYDTEKDFLNQTNPVDQKKIDFSKIPDKTTYYTPRDYFNYDIAALIAYNDDENYNAIIEYLQDKEKIDKFNKTLKDRTINNFSIGASYSYDTLSVISSAIHNMRTETTKNAKYILNFLAKDLRKNKVKTIKDYLEKKQWKNKKTLDEYRKDLFTYLNNIIHSNLMDNLDHKFDGFIEINGEYYDHAYDSEEVLGIIYQYVKQFTEIIKKIIYNKEDDIFKYSFYLSRDKIEEFFNLDNVKLSDKLKITDLSYKYEDGYLDQSLKDVFYYIIIDVSNNAYDKIKELYSEYQKNLYT